MRLFQKLLISAVTLYGCLSLHAQRATFIFSGGAVAACTAAPQTFAASNTAIVPAGCGHAIFEVWGPGGDGSSGDNISLGGGGGGGGGYGMATFPVSPGQSYTFYVGVNSNDEAHIYLTIGSVNKITVPSGQDGNVGTGGIGSGPTIGSGASSITSITGGTAADPVGANGTTGGTGAGPGGGAGGVGGNGSNVPGNGSIIGGGGGGVFYDGSGSNVTGKAARGQCKVTWST